MEDLSRVRLWVEEATRIVALTGAGISTESGIPDFRGPAGVWTRDPEAEKLSNIHYYMSDPAIRKRSWQARLAHPAWQAAPNAGHRALAALERRGKLHGLITQNIDGLHQLAGSQRVLELHGTARQVGCLDCAARYDTAEMHEAFLAQDSVPACRECGGMLKHAVVSCGQSLRADVLQESIQWARQADLFLVLGSSLVVEPAASLPRYAREYGARLVIINRDPRPLDDVADAIELRGVLEGTAARFAAERLEVASELSELAALTEELDVVVAERRPRLERYVELNDEYHRTLVGLAKSDTIARAIANAVALPFASPSALLASQAALSREREVLLVAQHQHRMLLDAVRSGHGARAEDIAREHARLAKLNLDLVLASEPALERLPGAPLLRRVV